MHVQAFLFILPKDFKIAILLSAYRRMSIEVDVGLRKERRQVQFFGAGGLAKLLPAIVHAFKDSLLSENDIMVMNEKDNTILSSGDEIQNGSSLKVVFKPKATSERDKVKADPSASFIDGRGNPYGDKCGGWIGLRILSSCYR